MYKQLLPSLEVSKTLIPREHLREGKHPQNVPKIIHLHITQLLTQCEHKGQKNGLIPHINIQKNWLNSQTEMRIYHPDLSIFRTFYIPTVAGPPPPCTLFWLLSLDASAVIIWGFRRLNMVLKTEQDQKKGKKRKSGRVERLENRCVCAREKTKEKRISPREMIQPGNKSRNGSWHRLHSHLWPPN